MRTALSHSHRTRRMAVNGLALLALLAAPAGATTFSVDTVVDLPDGDILDGICSWMADPEPSIPSCSLRAAVMQANATPIDPSAPVVAIHLLAGENYPLAIAPAGNDVLGASGDLDVFRPVAIGAAAVFEPARASITVAEPLERAFHFRPGAAGSSVFGLRMRREYVDDADAGPACLLLADKDTGMLTIERAEIYDTPCAAQGTMIFRSGTNVVVRDSEFHHGSRAMLISGANVTLERSTFHSNTGAGTTVATSSNAFVTVSHSTFVDNPIHIGATDSNVLIVSSTFGNVTGATGSILIDAANASPLLRIQNSIFQTAGTPTCFFAKPTHGTLDISGSVFADASCISDMAPATPNLDNANVQLAPLASTGGKTRTMELLPTSDGIDWIPPQFCNPNGTDQRGYPRAVDYSGLQPAHCDAGATELQTEPPPPEGHIFGDGFEND